VPVTINRSFIGLKQGFFCGVCIEKGARSFVSIKERNKEIDGSVAAKQRNRLDGSIAEKYRNHLDGSIASSLALLCNCACTT